MGDSFRRIFLLSHMRAYSSLIGHILGSHRAINGYYEMHQRYVTTADLQLQLDNYTTHDPLKPDSLYLFDKLLHNPYSINLDLPALDNAIVLVAIREPQQSIKSIIELFQNKAGVQNYAKPRQAAAYYQQRLDYLSRFCQQHAGRYYYFDAEMIHQHSEQILSTLTRWLQLATPLSAHYDTFSRSGKARAGDTSAQIRSGRIIRAQNRYDNIRLDEAMLNDVRAQYQLVREQLVENALEAVSI